MAAALAKEEEMKHRRLFLRRTAAALSGVALVGGTRAEQLAGEPWERVYGTGFTKYGQPARYEQIGRHFGQPYGELAPGSGAALSPIEALDGIITPNPVHFIRSHSGTPDIDPKMHRLHIHGLVERPLRFSVDALMRYPRITRIHFLECSGNSSRALTPQPAQVPAGAMHGNVSCAEWSGFPLRVLLEEAGVRPQAKWILAEGADSAHMSRSVPLEKALDDAMVALYQNGERLRPEQGYPVRLLLPGWEGNMSVKWLRRIKLTDAPTHTKDETSKYTDALPDGRALQFTFEMGVKSVITRPSSTMKLAERGFHEISGIAWSGAGRVRRVEVSTDGGQTWADAALTGDERSRALVRFRHPWEWNGGTAVLQSRATDEKGNVQPPRRDWVARYAPDARFHNNSIVSWGVESDGSVRHVYA
jgi:sulfane dehydrogenase subunit SoxC